MSLQRASGAPPAAAPSPLPHARLALALAEAAARASAPLLALVPDARTADALADALAFFAGESIPVHLVPEREMLPYDVVSPPRELASSRLRALAMLPGLTRGIVIATADFAIERLPPRNWLITATFACAVGETIPVEDFRRRLVAAGYASVGEVRTPGEFALRGGLLDVFPSGVDFPIRIELFDEEIETLRSFDPDTQLTRERIETFAMLPAWEFPFDKEAVTRFRKAWRARFSGDPMSHDIYRSISAKRLPPGIESWLPLFFDSTSTLADYLPGRTLRFLYPAFDAALGRAFGEVESRYESLRHDVARPLLRPAEAFVPRTELEGRLHPYPLVEIETGATELTASLPEIALEARREEPLARFLEFAERMPSLLLAVDSAGRRESVREILARRGLETRVVDSWSEYRTERPKAAIAIVPLEDGFVLAEEKIAVVPDAAVFGERVGIRHARRRTARDPATIIRDLTDLAEGSPVVHQDYGVGRFSGLTSRTVDGNLVEFALLEYAEGAKLYVPVASLDRLSRYLGADAEHAPLTRLGSGQWDRARRRAAMRARDVAAELLDLYARRAARAGFPFRVAAGDWERFVQAFPFEETADQARAIDEVLTDLRARRPMDRLVCGDVGFGKTEVALRAAFVVVENCRQVAVLVPTTLLADQHFRSFTDRFAEWPVRVELLSRFRTRKQQVGIRESLAEGKIDIVIGTHALLGRDIHFKSLGLVIVDEEHRFGVRHKERLKSLRAEVDMLTLTATPIPRTLSMTLTGIRDLSIIATAPEERLPVKTVVSRWQDGQVRDALLRELRRGGQAFFVHSDVRSIDELAAHVRRLVPEVRLRIGHGQMPERELESLMVDFYHRRFDVLVSTSIIESGIDIPTANTIIVNNAHRFGLAQLHQLRGRVGRSRHQAYAYLIAPPEELMGREAKARLEAIASIEELGAGFYLATQDLEIRGAGALLGEEQSGQIEEIGLELYNRMLERAVKTLKAGGTVDPEADVDVGCEVDLGVAALLPSAYVPDVNLRLVLYKRIANARDDEALEALEEELHDRFGTLPQSSRRLFAAARIKQSARALGITRIQAGKTGVRIDFSAEPAFDSAALVQLVQQEPQVYRLHRDRRLEMRRPMPEFAHRVETVSELLHRICPHPTQPAGG